jgi:F-type H+-transporting ATPase subunit gamma
VVTQQLLPIERRDIEGPQVSPKPATHAAGEGGAPSTEYLFEPEPKQMFNRLLPLHVQVQVFRAMLESNAAFYAAQMTAMDAATRNSSEMIEQLTLYMNKVRQAAITREIIEVVSGAGAL